MNTEGIELTSEQMEIGSRLFKRSGVKERHRKFRAEDNTSEAWSESYHRVKRTIEKGGLCALLGKHGTGKTQAGACGVSFCCYFLGKSARYEKAFDVFLAIREAMKNRDESEKKAIHSFVEPHLLIIDAFEVRGDTEFENRCLNHIIDLRYDRQKPTIIISNDTIHHFVETVGVAFVDRMKESGGVILFDGQSFRER